jgi:hypothetical protein
MPFRLDRFLAAQAVVDRHRLQAQAARVDHLVRHAVEAVQGRPRRVATRIGRGQECVRSS